ncbi:unnamed protein product [Rotaria sp. Silwood2]|nr:unnamed protein product [Rotaria sp. Silwood2]
MTNSEKQTDEILALQSIFDKKFHLLTENQYEILIEFDLPTSFTIRFKDKKSIIQHLPPLSLIINYHDEYPREVCVYDCIVLIKQEITNEFIIRTNFEEQENDPRAINGYNIENGEKIFQNLIDYNQRREEELFRDQLQTCSICTDIIPGIDCICLHRCGHFYCRSCLNHYIQMKFENGKFGENLHCSQDYCKQALLLTEIRQAIQNEEVYKRYERLTLQHGLESIKDII